MTRTIPPLSNRGYLFSIVMASKGIGERHEATLRQAFDDRVVARGLALALPGHRNHGDGRGQELACGGQHGGWDRCRSPAGSEVATMTNAQPTPEDELAIDVLIIGGGIQGLLILDRLTAEGRSCALVTASDVGTGQTLHSHGLLNAGFGMMGPELIRLLQEVVLPDLAQRGIETYGQWGAIVPPTFPEGELMEPLPGLALRGGWFQRLGGVHVDK